jgi:hypothetical protein
VCHWFRGFEDQVAWPADHDLVAEQRADLPSTT